MPRRCRSPRRSRVRRRHAEPDQVSHVGITAGSSYRPARLPCRRMRSASAPGSLRWAMSRSCRAQVNGTALYRVRLGPVASEAEADRLLRQGRRQRLSRRAHRRRVNQPGPAAGAIHDISLVSADRRRSRRGGVVVAMPASSPALGRQGEAAGGTGKRVQADGKRADRAAAEPMSARHRHPGEARLRARGRHRHGAARQERRRAHAAGLDEQGDDRLSRLRLSEAGPRQARRRTAGQRARLAHAGLEDVRAARLAHQDRGSDARHGHRNRATTPASCWPKGSPAATAPLSSR